MKIPYVIDNIDHRLADVLNELLRAEPGRQFDVATAYFSIRGFQQLRHTLPGVSHFRLLLGDTPQDGVDLGLRPDSAAFLRHELNAEPLSANTQRLVEELVRFLRRGQVDVRLYHGIQPGERGRKKVFSRPLERERPIGFRWGRRPFLEAWGEGCQSAVGVGTAVRSSFSFLLQDR